MKYLLSDCIFASMGLNSVLCIKQNKTINIQTQSLLFFYKKGVLKKHRKIRKKTRMLESLFYPDLNFIKKILTQVFSCDFLIIFKNTFFRRTALVTISESL